MANGKVAHRSKEDEQWQETKRLVSIRDKNMCVACRMLTPREYQAFMASRPIGIGMIQHAHIIPVGRDQGLTYDVDNVVCLCAAHHDRIDSMRDLVTGKAMKRSDQEHWWERIKKYAGIKKV